MTSSTVYSKILRKMEAFNRDSITVNDIRAQKAAFDAASENFAREFVRGQGMWTGLRTAASWATGTETPQQRIQSYAGNVREEMSRLIELRSRAFAAAAPAGNDPLYRERLARKAAKEQIKLTRQIRMDLMDANSTQGVLDQTYRYYINLMGDAMKLGTGFILALGGRIIGGEAEVAANYAAAPFIAAFLMDTGRRAYLEATTRNNINTQGLGTDELKRRGASLIEGWVTGDLEGVQIQGPILDELEQRAARDVRVRLDSDGVKRPDFMLPNTDPANIENRETTRTALSDSLARYNLEQELIRSRDVARGSRQIRTLLALGAIATAASLYFMRPAPEPEPEPRPVCGEQDLKDDDWRMRQQIGTGGVSSLRGIAENLWFRRIYGRDFNHNNAQDRVDYDRAWGLDIEGNSRIVDELVREIKAKNPDLRMVGTDLFMKDNPPGGTGPIRSVQVLCDLELNQTYIRINR